MNVDISPIEKVGSQCSATELQQLHRQPPAPGHHALLCTAREGLKCLKSHTQHNIACDVTHNTTKWLHHDLNRRLVNRLLPGFLYIM